MHSRLLPIALVLCGALDTWAQGSAPVPPRGELLYMTHCIACHDSQVHWRDKRIVNDWPSLTATVRRWQEQARLNWREDDIVAVAHYLNRRYYRLNEVPARVAGVHTEPVQAASLLP